MRACKLAILAVVVGTHPLICWYPFLSKDNSTFKVNSRFASTIQQGVHLTLSFAFERYTAIPQNVDVMGYTACLRCYEDLAIHKSTSDSWILEGLPQVWMPWNGYPYYGMCPRILLYIILHIGHYQQQAMSSWREQLYQWSQLGDQQWCAEW